MKMSDYEAARERARGMDKNRCAVGMLARIANAHEAHGNTEIADNIRRKASNGARLNMERGATDD